MLKKLFILLFFTCSHTCLCQELVFKQYTVHDGLAQMQVLDIFEDRKGYLWIGTKGGVSRFNGETFENFNSFHGLPDNSVHSIKEDSKGNIWFLCNTGIAVFNGSEIKKLLYPSNWRPSNGSLEINKNDEIYIYKRYEPQLIKFVQSEFQVLRETVNPNNSYGMSYNMNNDEVVVTVNEKGIFKVENDKLVPTKISKGNNYYSIKFDTQLGKIYYGVRVNNVIKYYALDKNVHLYDYNLDRKELFNISYDSLPSNYYRITHNKYLQKVDKKEQTIKNIGSFNFDYPKGIFKDSKGTYWVKTEQGLIRWFGDGILNYSQEEFSYAWGFVEDIDGSIWIPKLGGALYHYKNKQITEETGYLKFTNNKNFYFGSLLDQNNNLLFAHNIGIFIYDRTEFQLLKPHKTRSKNIPLILYEDKRRELLLAGTGEGINVFKNYNHVGYWGKEANIHDCTYIVSIEKDTTEKYWLGSYYGLSRFDWERQTSVNYTQENGKLPSKGVISMIKDSWGGIWFGGTNTLMKYDYKTDSILTIPIPDIGDVNILTEVKNKRLLVASITGLYWIDLNQYYKDGTLEYFLMNQHNGYLGIEPTQNSFLNDSKGNLWLASSTITTKFDPTKLDFTNHSLETIITEVNEEKLRYTQLDTKGFLIKK